MGGGTTASNEYDPFGRRRSKTVNGTQTRFVSDKAEKIEKRDATQAILRRYVYGSGVVERITMFLVATPTLCPAGGGNCEIPEQR